ncbi:MAG: N-acetyltransferase [Candidatus Latescibacterota bacterium]|nr:MAG: N-acetyltransferase [Candidatus Latescibacterota bacterium]
MQKIGEVVIGNNATFDDGVLLAYLSPRKEVPQLLRIGDDAVIRSGSVIYAGTTIGDHFETGHNVVVREENEIGAHVSIWNNSIIDYGCRIGNNVKIHCNCYVAQFTVIEDGVFLAPGVTIANDVHPGCPDSKPCMKGPILKSGVQVGVNATILPYVTIGERTLVGGGAVVTRDMPAESVVYGNPARVHGSIYDLKCTTDIRDRGPYV